ncbi:dihydroorotase family protein [Rhizobium sp. 18055]|uniref:dihydroorotase n=1 Tax=Rhizobium sp. 18055 TaxID=2681403 RepID=UPI00135958DA|nr:dihydroorotase family protein [Rhizobium sp. 18055]
MTYDSVICGRLVTPNGIVENGWIAITNETIAAIGSGERPQADVVADYGDAYVLPGIIDGQTHAGSQIGFPGLRPTTRMAVMGGVTTIVDMPYDEPLPITTANLLIEKIAAIHRYAVCDVALYGTVPVSPDQKDVSGLIAGGVCAFKISSFEAHPLRFPRISNDATLALLEILSSSDLPLGLHNEDQEIVRNTTARLRAEGKLSAEFHSPSRPEVAELTATANFLELGAATGTHVHIVHISTPSGFRLVEDYRQRGVAATGEMCVHYLHFDAATDMPRLGGKLKVNPPIREGRREALWKVIEDDQCAFISSDHSAWPIERKVGPTIYDDAAGMPGLDTLLPVFFTDAAARYGADHAASMAADLMSARVARFFGLSQKGALAPGMDADIAVLAPGPVQYQSADVADGPGWSAYDGETFAARPVATYVRGQLAWDGKEITAPEGHGRFVARATRQAGTKTA